jgi:hypothetical protein
MFIMGFIIHRPEDGLVEVIESFKGIIRKDGKFQYPKDTT